MARRVKTLFNNPNERNHRDHRSKKNRRNKSKVALQRERDYRRQKERQYIAELDNDIKESL